MGFCSGNGAISQVVQILIKQVDIRVVQGFGIWAYDSFTDRFRSRPNKPLCLFSSQQSDWSKCYKEFFACFILISDILQLGRTDESLRFACKLGIIYLPFCVFLLEMYHHGEELVVFLSFYFVSGSPHIHWLAHLSILTVLLIWAPIFLFLSAENQREVTFSGFKYCLNYCI